MATWKVLFRIKNKILKIQFKRRFSWIWGRYEFERNEEGVIWETALGFAADCWTR